MKIEGNEKISKIRVNDLKRSPGMFGAKHECFSESRVGWRKKLVFCAVRNFT